MRLAYSSIGIEFAITNSGGLRVDLTCPTADNPNDFCPAYTPPPFPISRGQVLGVLPFGNVVFTVSINGAELKTMLENGVSRMPAVDGRFPQVSGLCFSYDISAPAGSRVLGAVRQAADGSCIGAPIDLTAASTNMIAENDFMATDGDGYPKLYGRGTTQNLMDQALADYIAANSPISPAIPGRVSCMTGGATACPVVTPYLLDRPRPMGRIRGMRMTGRSLRCPPCLLASPARRCRGAELPAETASRKDSRWPIPGVLLTVALLGVIGFRLMARRREGRLNSADYDNSDIVLTYD